MDRAERQECVSKIVSGVTIFTYNDKDYVINPPQALHIQLAEKIYKARLKQAKEVGVLSSEQFLDNLIDLDLWSDEEEARLQMLPKTVEEFKVLLYQNYVKYRNNDKIKKSLEKAQKEQLTLQENKDLLRKESAEGLAETAKYRHLICSNITDIYGNVCWEDYNIEDANLIRFAIESYLSARLSEDDIRELSRKDPWVGLWSVGKSENGVFGKPSYMLTEEQKSIISWSRIYDSINESPECPPNKVVEDDDMLDGWLILQSRKRENEKEKGQSDKDGLKGDEVYLMADDAEGASRIYGLNDTASRGIIKTRQKQIQKSDAVSAENMIDAKLQMQQQAVEAMKNAGKR